jgi:glycosyltransferase involved in cell wall biosynthesis
MSGASLVVAGNQYLADFARAAGAPFVTVLPTVIDLDRYPDSLVLSSKKSSFPPCVGWVGQRSTAFFLSPYRDIFTKITEAGLGRFSAVGIDTKALGLPMDSVEWSEKTEVSSISNFDVGIMPLVDEPFARGKCGYKLIQYMACGLPVVASPVGVNCQIVEHGVNGFLVETQTEWESALRTLLLNPDLRKKMGQAGRRKVEDQFSLQVTAPRLAALLKSVCEVP